MDVKTFIVKLAKAEGPDRNLDNTIGQFVGWRRVESSTGVSASGSDSKTIKWISPSGDENARVPHYTSNIDHAMQLAMSLGNPGGVGWEPGKASARIGNGPYFQAATPEIALCMAALYANEIKRQREDRAWPVMK